MKNNVLLLINTDKGKIFIPFGGLEQVDKFTERYSDRDELLTVLIDILNLPLKKNEVMGITISYEHSVRRDNDENIKYLPIKYNRDNYDLDGLRKSFANYLKEDHRRIMLSNIRFVRTQPMMDYVYEGKQISDRDIEMAVTSYLASGYKVNRDIYFMLKREGYPVKINKVVKKTNENLKREISTFDTDDEFFEYLKRYASLGEEESERAMEIIASYDIEEIEKKLHNPYYSIVDGVSNGREDDILSLEQLSEMSIEELTNYVQNFADSTKKRKR